MLTHYRIATLVALVILAGCASGPSRETVGAGAAHRIIAAYNIGDLLAQAAPAVSAFLQKNVPDEVDAGKRQRLDKAVARAYAPARLRDDVARRLAADAMAANRGSALTGAAEKLQMPLARRLIALESQVSGPDFTSDFNKFLKNPGRPRGDRRIKTMRALATNMQITRLQTDFNVTLLGSTIRARNLIVGADQRAAPRQIEAILTKARADIRGKLDQRVPVMLLYVYRRVDADALQRYAAMQRQPDMVWVNKALDRAITDTLSAAGQRVPKLFRSIKE